MHEQEVLALLRAGDERGAEALLRHYAPLMRYIIAPIVPDAQDREECLSDAALRVWEKFGTYDPARGSWTAWLTALTRNTALNRARKKSGGSEELSGDLPSAEPTPEERLLQQERRQLYRECHWLKRKYLQKYFRHLTGYLHSLNRFQITVTSCWKNMILQKKSTKIM